MGTVYRHFPDKDALLQALAREQFELLTGWAREALDAPEPGPALEALLWRGAEHQARPLSARSRAAPWLLRSRNPWAAVSVRAAS